MKKPFSATKIACGLVAPSFLLILNPLQTVFADDSVKILDDGLHIGITTANRSERNKRDTLSPVSVITRKEIESLQAQDIVDVLRLQNGIDISRTGSGGSTTSVFVRGVQADQVLVLIDGVRVSSSTTGQFDWSQLPVDQVERIEIVRGPRAALYGSDAIGGVIQIFTRKHSGTHASVSYGKYDTKRANAGFSAGDKTRFSLNLSGEESDGFSAQNAKGSSFNPDKDPYSKRGATLSLSHLLSSHSKMGLDTFYTRNKADFDQGKTDSELKNAKIYFKSHITQHWGQQLNLSVSNNDVESISSFGKSKFNSERTELDWQNNVKLSDKTTLLLGTSYREDSGKSADYNKTVTNKALFASLNHQHGRTRLDLSTRYDNHNQAGSQWTGQFAAGYDLTSATTLYASYGSAFKAPSVNELYYPGFFGSFAGNPDLKPETSKSFEVGLKSRIANNQHIEASLYRNNVDDLISFTGINNQAINSDKAVFKGFELAYSGSMIKLDWGLNLTLQSSEDKRSGKRLVRRPNTKISTRLGYALNTTTHIDLDYSHVSSRDDNDFSAFPSQRVKLDDYGLLNLSLQHRLGKHTSVGLRVENVTDEKYQQAYGFNTPRRGAYLTISYK